MNVKFQEYINQEFAEGMKNFGIYEGQICLNLSDQDITMDDLKSDILPFVKENSVECVLFTGTKTICDEGWRLISEVECIKKIIAINCNISNEGAKHLAKMKNLKELDVSNNKIGSIGALAIASMENLENLIIDGNDNENCSYTFCGNEGDRALQERDPVIRANYKKYAELPREVPSLQRISMFKVKELLKEKQIPESRYQTLDQKFKEKINLDIENDNFRPISNRPRI